MPLTTRTNGSASTNIITASWFNDFKTLLTGGMSDQEVTIKNNVVGVSIGASPSSAPTGAIATGTALGIGNYQYYYTYLSPDGESAPSPTSATITTTSGNQAINLTVTVGPTGTTGRNIYRTKVGGIIFFKVATVSDNTTTVYNDVIADTSLTVSYQGYNNFGGSFITKDASGATRAQMTSDGNLVLTPAPVVLNGTTGTASLYQTLRGTEKRVMIIFNSYKNGTGGNQTIAFPVPFAANSSARTYNGGAPPSQLVFQGTALNAAYITAWAIGGGTAATSTTFPSDAIGYTVAPFDSILFFNSAVTYSGIIILEGV